MDVNAKFFNTAIHKLMTTNSIIQSLKHARKEKISLTLIVSLSTFRGDVYLVVTFMAFAGFFTGLNYYRFVFVKLYFQFRVVGKTVVQNAFSPSIPGVHLVKHM